MEYNKRLYSISEFYRFIKDGLRTVNYMRRCKQRGLIEQGFITRIMLAVTEVNGCQACSYFHTGHALKEGMSDEAIQSILNGSLEGVLLEESVGLFFAQHYAEKKGYPDKDAVEKLIQAYGLEKAKGIIAATRMIMVGNTHGIAFGAFKERLKGKALSNSSLTYELVVMFGVIIFVPVAWIHGRLETLKGKKKFSYAIRQEID